MAMVLYADSQFTSPYAMSVFVALTEKQLPFDIRTLDLATGENSAPDYARTSVTQRVPAPRNCSATTAKICSAGGRSPTSISPSCCDG